MNKNIFIAVLIACFIGCSDGGNVTVTTGDATATSENESASTVEQSQLDELLPALVCTECDLAQMEATGRMFDTLSALVSGQQVLPTGQQVNTPLAQPQITIAIDAYSEAVNTLQDGADTMTTEATFDDKIDDLLDSTDVIDQPGETVV